VTVYKDGNKYSINLNKYPNINKIKFEVIAGSITSFEEVGVITDGMDGSSREVLYYKSAGEVPVNPTPNNYLNDDYYQTKELPSQ
jgi:hypothetical protein